MTSPETAKATTAPILVADDVTIDIAGASVLTGVRLEVSSSQIWFLLGRNGAGKTTLVRAILGELMPRHGTIDLRCGSSQVGFVPQESHLHRNLPTTVEEFVGLGLVGTEHPAGERRDRLQWALSHVGLSGREGTSYWSLSGGQRQRASVARALIRRPRLLVLDEPTNNLDIAAERAIVDLIEELQRIHEVSTIFVSHNLTLARKSATHVALFDRGRVRTGTAAELLTDETLDQLFAPDSLAGEPA